MRVFWAHAGYSEREDYSLATPHYEIWACGHVVTPDGSSYGSGFTRGKAKLRDKLKAAGYYMRSAHVGNTAKRYYCACTNCPGYASNENGHVWVVHMGRVGPY